MARHTYDICHLPLLFLAEAESSPRSDKMSRIRLLKLDLPFWTLGCLAEHVFLLQTCFL